MLFNSFVFLGYFFPITLAGFYALTYFRFIEISKVFLIIASLVFYGWFTPWFVLVLFASVYVTLISVHIMQQSPERCRLRKLMLYLGLLASLGNLIFWKYTDFVITGFNAASGMSITLLNLILPLGVSFYTFQLLTFVVDAYAGRIKDRVKVIDFSLYALFFPQLVVGPIVRYDELLPQIRSTAFGKLRIQNLVVGISIFIIGLTKKVVLADNLALMVDPTFERVGAGEVVSVIEAWRGALAYTLQLYFDFSGYSDMAIGIARTFGMRLPINFHSPLRSKSTLDFWRRWHITLTRMTTLYVFNPISMMTTRFAANCRFNGVIGTLVMVAPACLVTFVLIGFWHGASATFLFFGLLHSVYAVIDYIWRKFRPSTVLSILPPRIQYFSARVITFILIVVSLVLFRSPDVPFFIHYAGFLFISNNELGSISDIDYSLYNIALLAVALLISQFSPNTHQLFGRYRPGLFSYAEHARDRLKRLPQLNAKIGIFLGFLLVISLAYIAQGRSEFLYFGF